MNGTQVIRLADGRDLEIEVLTYPIPFRDQMNLVDLWTTEWTKGDYNWFEAMNGAYSDSLTIHSAIARINGRAVGTASVAYPCNTPEVSVVGSVLTHKEYRRLGIAAHLTNLVVDRSFATGCQVCYLGATRSPHCVYLRCGFEWWNGGVMRRAAPGMNQPENHFFAAGQTTTVREACWGDLPGFACFVVQPWDCLILDYPRALISGKYGTLQRCVSNFPAVYDDLIERGGLMCVLTGESPHRVLGFGSLTPGRGVGRRHKGIVDFATQDDYRHDAMRILDLLLAAAEERKVESVQAWIASSDQKKANEFLGLGFERLATIPGAVRLSGDDIDVNLFERKV
jgi:GNAT superfamily N-acetyltransferase